MAEHLTDAIVKRLPPPEPGGKSTSKIFYDDVAGFGVRVTVAGARSFILRYRTRGAGRERTFTIGSATHWQTTAARAEAKRLRRLIDQGGDPVGDIEAEREAPTMANLCDRFLAEHVATLRPGTAYAYRMLIDNHVRPFFGQQVKVDDIAYADCDALHRKITKSGTPYAANRCVAVYRRCSASPSG